MTKRYVDPGARISQGGGAAATNPIVTVMDLSRVKVLANVPERDISSVHLGDTVSLTTDTYPDRVFQGQVTKFAPALDPSSRTLLVEIHVPNPDLVLKPGMFARLTLVLERRTQALAVPSEALMLNELGSLLFAVATAEDGVPLVRRVAVRTRVEDAGQVEILAGVQPGDRIDRPGRALVRDGSRVRLAEDEPARARTAER